MSAASRPMAKSSIPPMSSTMGSHSELLPLRSSIVQQLPVAKSCFVQSGHVERRLGNVQSGAGAYTNSSSSLNRSSLIDFSALSASEA